MKTQNLRIRTRPEFRSGTGSGGFWAGTGSGTGRFGRNQIGTAIFSCWIIGFLCLTPISYLHHVPPPVPRLYHVLPFSSQTTSSAPLQFPGCITCSPPVPWLYDVLPSSSQTVSRATLQFPKFITCSHIPFGDTWRGHFFHRLLYFY